MRARSAPRANECRRRACPVRAEIAATAQLMFGRDHARNRSAIFSSQAVVVSRHVHEEGGDVNQAINSIQNSAVSWNGCAHVFGSNVALDHADGKIAELSADSDN